MVLAEISDSADSNVITSVMQQVKDVNRVSVFINSKYVFSLTVDQLLETRLKKGIVLSVEQIEEFKKISGDGKLRSRALEWVLNRPRSRRELIEYLKRKGATELLVERIVTEFIEKKYVDDEHFAIWLTEIRLRKNKSSRAIRAELLSKGVSQEILRKIEAEPSNNSDKNALHALIMKLRGRPRYADEKKLISYLLSKGFSYPDIKEALNNEVY